MSNEEALSLCISVMKNVTYCFNSMKEAGIKHKHPSCQELLQNTIDKVEGRYVGWNQNKHISRVNRNE